MLQKPSCNGPALVLLGVPSTRTAVCSTHAFRAGAQGPDGAVSIWLVALRSPVPGGGYSARRRHGYRKFVVCPCRLWLPPALRPQQGFARDPARVRGRVLPDRVSGAAMGWWNEDHVRHPRWAHVSAGPAEGVRCGHGAGSRTGVVRDTARTTIVEPRPCDVVADGQPCALDTGAQVPSSHSGVDDGWRDRQSSRPLKRGVGDVLSDSPRARRLLTLVCRRRGGMLNESCPRPEDGP